jgi:predicted nucleic acid-binding protein
MDKAFFETSMFLEPFKKKERKSGNYGKKALALLKGLTHLECGRVVSASVLSECLLVLSNKEKVNRYNKTAEEIRTIHDEILKEFEIIGISKEAINLASEIITEDDRLDPFDVLNFSCAATNGCKAFFFIDGELEKNKTIKRIADEKGMSLAPFNMSRNLD